MFLAKREIRQLLELMEAFGTDKVEILACGGNGIGQVVTVKVYGVDTHGYTVTVEKVISGPECW